MFSEKNKGCNLPAAFDIYATKGNEYHFMYVMKGGGSANKTFLFQQTKSLLNEKSFLTFLDEKIKTIGTAACPPYHLALVVSLRESVVLYISVGFIIKYLYTLHLTLY